MDIRSAISRVKFGLAKIYWKLAKPKTFGVKALVFKDGCMDQTLLVRHSYGDTRMWNLAGGGFDPKKENEDDAIRREIQEELGVSPMSVRKLGTYKTGSEGKVDTVEIFEVIIPGLPEESVGDGELQEYGWFSLDYPTGREDVARVVRSAVRQYRGENNFESYL